MSTSDLNSPPTSDPPIIITSTVNVPIDMAATQGSQVDGAGGGEEVERRSSSRTKQFTEKGLGYEIEKRERNFRTKVSAWRRRAGRIESMLSESTDSSTLKQERELLGKDMNEVIVANEENNEILVKAEKPIAYSHFEAIESDNYHLLKRISERIKEIEKQSEIASGTRSKSRRSSHSSHSSKGSISKRAEAAAQAAVLKAKLKYIDQEAEQKANLEKLRADLDKLQIMKEIDMAEAKVDAIVKVEQDTNTIFDADKLSHLIEDKEQFVSDYVESHSYVPTTDKIPLSVPVTDPIGMQPFPSFSQPISRETVYSTGLYFSSVHSDPVHGFSSTGENTQKYLGL
ncbi:hypothetical protein HOLleu_01213 [Holothuria leucospilota]|uniref:Uncharacterized protein n=1 Tax=Holothuria leucospilota TaxID=206669 RepID=A0A9Q1HKQ0_HOLLE|nr:hypothetical protein HOLleu_01213 [Holothuria leucospilota]